MRVTRSSACKDCAASAAATLSLFCCSCACYIYSMIVRVTAALSLPMACVAHEARRRHSTACPQRLVHKLLSLDGLQGLLCALQLLLQVVVGYLHDRDAFRQMSSTELSVRKLAAPAVCSAGHLARHFAGRPAAQHEIQTKRTRIRGFLILLQSTEIFSHGGYLGLLHQDLS